MILEGNKKFTCDISLSPEDFLPVTKTQQKNLLTMS